MGCIYLKCNYCATVSELEYLNVRLENLNFPSVSGFFCTLKFKNCLCSLRLNHFCRTVPLWENRKVNFCSHNLVSFVFQFVGRLFQAYLVILLKYDFENQRSIYTGLVWDTAVSSDLYCFCSVVRVRLPNFFLLLHILSSSFM